MHAEHRAWTSGVFCEDGPVLRGPAGGEPTTRQTLDPVIGMKVRHGCVVEPRGSLVGRRRPGGCGAGGGVSDGARLEYSWIHK